MEKKQLFQGVKWHRRKMSAMQHTLLPLRSNIEIFVINVHNRYIRSVDGRQYWCLLEHRCHRNLPYLISKQPGKQSQTNDEFFCIWICLVTSSTHASSLRPQIVMSSLKRIQWIRIKSHERSESHSQQGFKIWFSNPYLPWNEVESIVCNRNSLDRFLHCTPYCNCLVSRFCENFIKRKMN